MTDNSFTLVRDNLSVQIADRLEDTIVNSDAFPVNEKLPSEQQLAEQYRVSRPVVREALKVLQERGLVALKNGLGAFVTKPKNSTVFSAVSRIMQMNNISDDDLTQMRAMLEVNAARLAAANITDDILEALRSNIEEFSDKALSPKERVALDCRFHNLIAKASGNALLEIFNDVLISLLTDYMGKGVLVAGGIDDAIIRHKKILHALEAHNTTDAVVAMNEHIAASKRNVEIFAANKTEVTINI
ncbi:FadR/GntR family transcriptional regulator [Treponema sp. Marseille-Q4130]|uniref:FadR/GntR family transcriptional regulator n=1 Tax=Treponema sp. Marseille-Q4130 TaxID=2766702 RepID=UPI00165253B5|nr:FadR/GntR family transcriptional regulator [Treponema sp. Marseille-Q4130]MBC6720702.1 FadR family transcriptional regulator [Treponema sp. Marseille-Q4130]